MIARFVNIKNPESKNPSNHVPQEVTLSNIQLCRQYKPIMLRRLNENLRLISMTQSRQKLSGFAKNSLKQFYSGNFLKKHKSLNNPSSNQVREVRKPRRMAAAVPRTSTGAKTSFTKSYTVREPDHLEIYAFFLNTHNFSTIVYQIKNSTGRLGGILCA